MSQFYDQASLVMVPSGYKDGKLYSQKPLSTSGELSFSRGSDIEATRVNANGYIEKAQVNLLLQSNSFSNSPWVLSNSTMTSGQAGYDGTNDAWLYQSTSTFVRTTQIYTLTGVSSLSVYAKAGTSSFLFIEQLGTTAQAWFNLSTGALGSTTGSVFSSSITSVGNGWYRCVMSSTQSAGSELRIRMSDANLSSVTTAASNIYIQDAQLNYGLVAQTYQETTTAAVVSGITDNMPRLNYDPANPTCPSLLLEPSRTNLIPSSEYLSFSGYTLRTISVTENYAISPEGVQNASLLTPSGSDAAILENISVTSGTTYAMSVWLKSATGSNVSTTIALGSAGFPESEGDGGKYKNITVTTEWQRFSIVSTADASVGTDISIGGFSGLATGENILAYGWQFEAGSYHTSYIPTYGSSATRTADAASKTGISSLIGQTEGTFFAEVDFTDTNADQMYLTISDGTSNNRIHIGFDNTSNWLYCNIRSGGAAQGLITSSSPSAGIKKIAVGYKLNDYVLYINGVQVGVDSSALVPACSRLDVGGYFSAGYEYPVKQALLFKTRLPNSDLATLTNL